MKMFDVKVEPWRKTGNKVVLIPPTEFQRPIGCYDWTDETEARLKTITDRPVVVKREKGNLAAFIADAWAVVTWASVAGVEAALMGVPVFSTPRCPSYPVNAGPLESIETPQYSEGRHAWACSLAYPSWHTSEIKKIRYSDYDYSLRDDLPLRGLGEGSSCSSSSSSGTWDSRVSCTGSWRPDWWRGSGRRAMASRGS